VVRIVGVVVLSEQEAVIENYHPIQLLLEYVKDGDLKKSLSDTSKTELNDWGVKLHIAKQVALAIRFFHLQTPPFLHRDIKSSNILCSISDDNWHVKLCDAGLSKQHNVEELIHTRSSGRAFIGSIYWKPPETYTQEFTTKSDIYSFGMLLYEIATRKEPFENCRDAEEVKQLVLSGARPDLNEIENEQIKQLNNDCWQHDPNERPANIDLVITRLNYCIKEHKNTTKSFFTYRYYYQYY